MYFLELIVCFRTFFNNVNTNIINRTLYCKNILVNDYPEVERERERRMEGERETEGWRERGRQFLY